MPVFRGSARLRLTEDRRWPGRMSSYNFLANNIPISAYFSGARNVEWGGRCRFAMDGIHSTSGVERIRFSHDLWTSCEINLYCMIYGMLSFYDSSLLLLTRDQLRLVYHNHVSGHGINGPRLRVTLNNYWGFHNLEQWKIEILRHPRRKLECIRSFDDLGRI
jgi:hypothetical protein